MDKEQQRNKIILQIWDLRAKVYTYRFIFGALSSPEKVEEFNEYFTGRILNEFQRCLETKILVDLRTILDRSEQDVISIFKIIDREKLAELSKIYRTVSIYINNRITHVNVKSDYSFRFIDVINTIEELQKVLDEDDEDIRTFWKAENLIVDELNELYVKVKRVNEWEKQNKR